MTTSPVHTGNYSLAAAGETFVLSTSVPARIKSLTNVRIELSRCIQLFLQSAVGLTSILAFMLL